jgi:uridine kinase
MARFYQEYLNEVLKAITKLEKPKFIIGIDGAGASGKSTFAKELLENITNSVIVQMDDFYLPEKNKINFDSELGIGVYFDWRRLENQVLIPFAADKEIMFQQYDWESGSLKRWQNISRKSSLIVEGVYSIRKELLKYYDLRIWIDCPYEIRLKRGIERDGIEMREYWKNIWMRQEDEYVKKQNPSLSADFIINGNSC